VTSQNPSPISIVGIGARVPGAVGVEEFWDVVVTGGDQTSADPGSRWGETSPHNPRRGGYIDGIDEFDNEWFGISAREAAVMDPQQRIALLTAVDAVHDAGIENLGRASNAAVIMGASTFDHGSAMLGNHGRTGPYTVTGSALSIVANRISYAMDYRGTSLVIDSACSSSLAAVNLGCAILLDPDVPFVVVGGVNALLLPHITDSFAESGFLSPDGRCKTFDKSADGYVRAEGSVVVVLRRRDDAQAHHNRIYADILGSAVNSDGRSNGLYAPNGSAQQRVIGAAWKKSGRIPSEAGYFECHGTGTVLGDAVEVSALAATAPPSKRPHDIVVGSLKTVTGHLEAAAGIAGLAKAALVVHHAIIPPTADFAHPAPGLKLAERRFEIVTTARSWRAAAHDRLVGVSSFGFGGTNAHAVLGGVEPVPAAAQNSTPATLPTAFIVSAREAHQLKYVARSWLSWIAERPGIDLADAAFTARRVATDATRAAIVASDMQEVKSALEALQAEERHPALISSPHGTRPGSTEALFLFPGQGGQYEGMGYQLAQSFPCFAEAARAAAHAVTTAGGPPVWSDQSGLRTGRTDVVQPSMFVYQVAMTALLGEHGIAPGAVIGHSLGEVAAAFAAGGLSLDDAAAVVVARSKALADLDGKGSMAMFELDAADARRLIAPVSDAVALAAVNGPRSVVLSGETVTLNALVNKAQAEGVFSRTVAVDFPAHSPAVDRVSANIERALQHLEPSAPTVPIYSTTDPTLDPERLILDAGYWRQNAGRTVELYVAAQTARMDGYSNVIEISPHPVLSRAVLDSTDEQMSVINTSHRENETRAFVECLAQLTVRGIEIEWPHRNETYTTPPQRVWNRTVFPLQTREAHPDVRRRIELDERLLSEHQVAGSAVVPAAQWLVEMNDASGRNTQALANFVVHDRIYVDVASAFDIDVVVSSNAAGVPSSVKVYTSDPANRSNSAVAEAESVPREHGSGDIPNERWTQLPPAVSAHTLYENFDASGVAYGPRFRRVSDLRAATGTATGLLNGHESAPVTTVDAALQVLAAAIPTEWPAGRSLLPVRVGYFEFEGDGADVATVRASAAIVDEQSALGTVMGFDSSGRRTLNLRDVEIRAVDHGPAAAEAAVMVENWEPVSPIERAVQGTRVYIGTGSVAAQLHERDESSARLALTLGVDTCWSPTVKYAGSSFVLVLPDVEFAAESALISGVDSAFSALRAVLENASPTALTLVVTGEVRTELAGAMIGAIRCLSLEYGIPIRVVQLPEAPNVADFDATVRIASSGDGPSELRIDSGVVSQRQLMPCAESTTLPVLDGDATYVVVGGNGGLGSIIVQWLLDNGAGTVAILSRGTASETADQMGQVVQIGCDATDRAHVARAMQNVRRSGRRIAGLVHAAGALRDAAFADINREVIDAVFLPKLIAAHHLLDETDRDALDFTILFSSAAGTIGSPGQAAYGAANVALDELAEQHRRTGRRVTSLAWGVVASVGMAHESGGADHLVRGGLTPLDEIKVRRLFRQSLAIDSAVLTAVALKPNSGDSALSARVRDLSGNREVVPKDHPRLPVGHPPSIATLVHQTVSNVLGIPASEVDPAHRFADLGISSLLAIDIRRRLELALRCRVSTAELFAHPSVTELARSLAERLVSHDEDKEEVSNPLVDAGGAQHNDTESDLYARATALLDGGHR
jgi:acyl transferase domain-containing protein/NADP-dependent 3-hydroxy acid dehydrogenase YdfG